MRFIVSNARGTPFDRAARAFGDVLENVLGSKFAYENLDDDSAEKAAQLVAASPPDGRTLLLGGKGALTSRPHTATSGYQPTDFAALGQIADAPISIGVGARSRFRTAADLFDAASRSPDTISYSTPHPLLTQRLAMHEFASRNGLKFKFAALAGENKVALQRVADGTLDFAVLAAHNYVKPAAAGEIRVLGIATPERVPFLPDVPTFVEQGFDLVTALWIGLLCRAGAPAERLAALRVGMHKTFADPAAARAIEELNLVPAFLGHAEFERKIRSEFETYRRVLKELGALPA